MPRLQNAAFRAEVHAYLGGCAKILDCLPIQTRGVEDDVRLLTTLQHPLSIAEFVKEVKPNSSVWIQQRGGLFQQFHWQAGDACSPVSQSNASSVVERIKTQEEHHWKITAQDEYRAYLCRHEEKWDERYVWN